MVRLWAVASELKPGGCIRGAALTEEQEEEGMRMGPGEPAAGGNGAAIPHGPCSNQHESRGCHAQPCVSIHVCV